jgi:hypothetical protein
VAAVETNPKFVQRRGKFAVPCGAFNNLNVMIISEHGSVDFYVKEKVSAWDEALAAAGKVFVAGHGRSSSLAIQLDGP